jgi:hypothetical protein
MQLKHPPRQPPHHALNELVAVWFVPGKETTGGKGGTDPVPIFLPFPAFIPLLLSPVMDNRGGVHLKMTASPSESGTEEEEDEPGRVRE